MNEGDDRLIRCFASVFPGATHDEIITSKFEAIPGWDSLRGVSLLAVLDEEFGVQLDMSELVELETFASLQGYISERGKLS